MSRVPKRSKEQMKWEALRLQFQAAKRKRVIEALNNYLDEDAHRLLKKFKLTLR